MRPTALETVALERSAQWAKVGLTRQYSEGPPTDNPAVWLALRGPNAYAFLTVWSSGDAEMDWGVEGDAHARHYNLASVNDLACIDDPEAVLSA